MTDPEIVDLPKEERPKPKSVRASREDEKLKASIQGMYEGIALLAFGVGQHRQDTGLQQFASQLMEPQMVLDMATGEPRLIDQRSGAEKISDAWMTAADRNPRIKTALRRVTEGGALAEVFALHLTLLMPFLPGIPGLAFMSPPTPPAENNGHG